VTACSLLNQQGKNLQQDVGFWASKAELTSTAVQAWLSTTIKLVCRLESKLHCYYWCFYFALIRVLPVLKTSTEFTRTLSYSGTS
jgi:hypothetical protein